MLQRSYISFAGRLQAYSSVICSVHAYTKPISLYCLRRSLKQFLVAICGRTRISQLVRQKWHESMCVCMKRV